MGPNKILKREVITLLWGYIDITSKDFLPDHFHLSFFMASIIELLEIFNNSSLQCICKRESFIAISGFFFGMPRIGARSL